MSHRKINNCRTRWYFWPLPFVRKKSNPVFGADGLRTQNQARIVQYTCCRHRLPWNAQVAPDRNRRLRISYRSVRLSSLIPCDALTSFLCLIPHPQITTYTWWQITSLRNPCFEWRYWITLILNALQKEAQYFQFHPSEALAHGPERFGLEKLLHPHSLITQSSLESEMTARWNCLNLAMKSIISFALMALNYTIPASSVSSAQH